MLSNKGKNNPKKKLTLAEKVAFNRRKKIFLENIAKRKAEKEANEQKEKEANEQKEKEANPNKQSRKNFRTFGSQKTYSELMSEVKRLKEKYEGKNRKNLKTDGTGNKSNHSSKEEIAPENTVDWSDME